MVGTHQNFSVSPVDGFAFSFISLIDYMFTLYLISLYSIILCTFFWYFPVVWGSRLFLAEQSAWTLSSPVWIFERGISFRAGIMCGATEYGPTLISSCLLGALPGIAECHSWVPQTASGTKTCWKALTAQHQAGAYMFVCTCNACFVLYCLTSFFSSSHHTV